MIPNSWRRGKWPYCHPMRAHTNVIAASTKLRRKGQCRRECSRRLAVQHESRRSGRMSPCQVDVTPDHCSTFYRINVFVSVARLSTQEKINGPSDSKGFKLYQ